MALFTSWCVSPSCVAHLAICRHLERDRVRAKLYKSGIATDIHGPILDCNQIGQQSLPMVLHDLHNSRFAVTQLLAMPCFFEMADDSVTYVIDKLIESG